MRMVGDVEGSFFPGDRVLFLFLNTSGMWGTGQRHVKKNILYRTSDIFEQQPSDNIKTKTLL